MSWEGEVRVAGGGSKGAADNGWEGDTRFCRLYGVKLDRN